ncbi:MAG: phosphotransferase family protein [Alphaproteobacteria bacterium]
MALDNRDETFTGTKDVADAHKFDEAALIAYMEANVEGFEGPIKVHEFNGGQSNPTYKIETPGKSYVLRRKPPGTLLPSAHAVDREYKVITALGETDVPAPRTYAMCEDESVLGTIFYIMDCVDGRVLWDPTIPSVDKENRIAIYDSMNDAIAKLHNVDYKAVGLEDFGKPGNYFARQISRWSKQYKASETEQIPEMDALMEWLPETIPSDDTTTIVHGDYRLDNMIFHPTEPRVVAILDWELCTLGHPVGDFSYHLMNWDTNEVLAGMSADDYAAAGIPTKEQYAALYAERTGFTQVTENLDWYMSYNLFRIGGILQGIRGRLRDGTAASDHADEMSSNVPGLAQQAWALAKKLGAGS